MTTAHDIERKINHIQGVIEYANRELETEPTTSDRATMLRNFVAGRKVQIERLENELASL